MSIGENSLRVDIDFNTGGVKEVEKKLNKSFTTNKNILKVEKEGLKTAKRERLEIEKIGKLSDKRLDNARSTLRIEKDLLQVEKRRSLLGRSVGAVGRGLKGVGGKVGAVAGSRLTSATGIGLLLGAGAGIYKGIGYASDIEEEENKLGETFKNVDPRLVASVVKKLEGYGFNKLEGKRSLALFGDVLKGVNFTEEEALAQAFKYTKSALDVRSFKNKDLESVILAFVGAITGEREMLKSLGAVLKQEDIDNESKKLLASGYVGADGRSLTEKDYKLLSPNDKKKLQAIATGELLFSKEQVRKGLDSEGNEVTGDKGLLATSLDDFSRTQESYANQLYLLKNEIVNKLADFGDPAKRIAADLIFPRIREMLEGFNSEGFAEKINKGFDYLFGNKQGEENLFQKIGSFFEDTKNTMMEFRDFIRGAKAGLSKLEIPFAGRVFDFGKEKKPLPENIKKAVEELENAGASVTPNINIYNEGFSAEDTSSALLQAMA